jgi:hypothetical protein
MLVRYYGLAPHAVLLLALLALRGRYDHHSVADASDTGGAPSTPLRLADIAVAFPTYDDDRGERWALFTASRAWRFGMHTLCVTNVSSGHAKV